MSSIQVGAVLRSLRKLAVARGDDQLPDRQLLHRFATRQDEDAYAALLQRHGPMVLGVCRSVLHDPHAAEDAFQATFVVLAQKAGVIQHHQAVSSWLYRVAYHVAVRARARAARRRVQERKAVGVPAADPLLDINLRELRSVLYEELERLPEKYRAPLVLCYLEEKTLEEAADLLGWTRGAVKGRLERGRDRLRSRLAERGLALSLDLFATGLATNSSSAGVSTDLARATLEAGLTLAADGAATGVVPAEVVALVRGVTRSLFSCKLRMVACGVLAASVALTGLGLLRPTLGSETEADLPPAQGAAGASAPTRVDAAETVRVHGRVVDADGKPVAGAKLYVGPAKKDTAPAVRATSGSDGRFAFTFSRSDLDPTLSQKPGMAVVARAGSLGSDWAYVRSADRDAGLTLRLGKDVPINGRVLNQDARPVAGARVRVLYASAFPGRPFDEVLEDFRHGRVERINRSMKAWMGPLPGQPAQFTTGADGRIRLAGFGSERMVTLSVEGPGIVTTAITVLTRPGQIVALGGQSYYPAAFDYVAQASRPIRGVVRDKATRRLVAGAEVRSQGQTTHTDREGRYELLGLPKTERYDLEVIPPKGQRYFAGTIHVRDTPGLDALPADIELVSGIPLRGRVTDRAGKAIAGARVEYHALFPNPYIQKLAAFPGGYGPYATATAGADGAFELAVLPGPGVVGVTAPDREAYMPALVTAKDLQDFFKGKVRGSFTDEQDLQVAAGGNSMSFIVQQHFHSLRLLDADEKAPSLTQNVVLEPARARKGIVVGPDGERLTGVTASGLTWGESETLKSSAFTVRGLNPRRSRNLLFLHKEKGLGAFLVLRGEETGPLTVKLRPCGAVRGRVVDNDGQPAAGLQLTLTDKGLAGLGLHLPITTDRAGRFRAAGLVPGMTYGLLRPSPLPRILCDIAVESGKTRDLGDIPGHLDDR